MPQPLKDIVKEIGDHTKDGSDVVDDVVTFYNQGGYDCISLTFDEILAMADAIRAERDVK